MFYTSELMAKHGIKAVFSDRLGGVSGCEFSSLNLGVDLGDDEDYVQQNLNILCQSAGLAIPHQCLQIHGSAVLWCSGGGILHQEEADILITKERQSSLAVRTADCLPILLADKQVGIVAAVHAGWRGTVAKVAQEAINVMCDKGTKAENILASLGPCIGSCCFEVSQKVGDSLSVSCGENIVQHRGDKVFADLVRANFLQLLGVGLSLEHIECTNVCTFCNTSPEYFSYRRDCGKTGRQLAVINLP